MLMAEIINNEKETIWLYYNLEKGDKVMCKNSKQIIEIMDDPPNKLSEGNSGSGRLVIFKNWISKSIYPCYLMKYDEKFQSMKIGDLCHNL